MKNINTVILLLILLTQLFGFILRTPSEEAVKNIVKTEILNNEYAKVGGKENYEVVSKLQVEQITQGVKQYKEQNGTSSSGNATKPTSSDTTDSANIVSLSKDEIIKLKKDGYIEGKEDAKITMIEFTDLECPYCMKQFKSNTIGNVLKEYPNDVNTIVKFFPLEFHKNAKQESVASYCAGEIGGKEAFLKYYKIIFERTQGNGEGFALTALAPLAKELGLDENKFNKCLTSTKFDAKIQENLDLGAKYGVTGTPGTLIINNDTGKSILLKGAYPVSEFNKNIELLLK